MSKLSPAIQTSAALANSHHQYDRLSLPTPTMSFLGWPNVSTDRRLSHVARKARQLKHVLIMKL
jgi:hypothetical protein